MKCLAAAALVAGGIFAASVSTASAATIIDGGWQTIDTDTGLRWLDVTATLGLSYSEVSSTLLGSGQLYDGWRYATVYEVSQLFTNEGVTDGYDGYQTNATELANLTNLIGLLGKTNDPEEWLHTIGITGTEKSIGVHWSATLYLKAKPNPNDWYQISKSQWGDDSNPSWNSGSFLVAPVPLPAGAWLLLSALGGLGFAGWRKKAVAA